MRPPAAFLKTRIARRVFGLFLLCAVLPTAVLAAASYWMVTRELQEQARTQLAQTAKVSGTILLARLHEADRDFADLVEALRRDPSFRADRADAGSPGVRFSALGIGVPGRASDPVLGAPRTIPPALAAPTATRHLRLDRTFVVVDGNSRRPEILMVRTLDPSAGEGLLVYGVVPPGHLWGEGDTESLVPADTDFCVYSQGIVEPLHCSGENGERRVSQAFGTGKVAAVGGVWDVFLGFDFAAPAWSVRVSRPLAAFSAPIEFRRSVLLTLALGVWLVVLASNVLLRYRLDPVAKLQAATQRLAAGDFSATVTLSTRDELEDLATAFNTMASGLRDQFGLLAALHEVDRQALIGQSDVEVARAALLHFPRLLPTEETIIAVRVPAGDDPDASVVWRLGSSGQVEQERLTLSRSGFAELEQKPDHWRIHAQAPQPGLLRALAPVQGRAYLVLPLSDRGVCFAAIVIGASDASDGFSESEVRRARQVGDQVALALANSRLVQRLNMMSWGTLQALARSIDAVSPWTAGHSERVTRVGVAIGRQLGLAPDLIDQLHRGGLLHDVGKIGVPSAILDKPGKLDDTEFEAIRAHPVIGARILEPIHAYEDVIPIVRHHHERFDGSGYPDRLSGRAIPYLARVLSVADVYDALVSRRPYREGWAHQAAVDYITKRAGVEFDPGVVEAFLLLVAGPDWPDTHGQSDSSISTPVALSR